MLILLSHGLGSRLGLAIGLGLSLPLSAIWIWCSEFRTIRKLRAQPLEGHDAWGLNPVRDQLCHKLRVEPPVIWKFPSPTPMVLCIGSKMESTHLLFSESLLARLTPSERETVMAIGLSYLQVKQKTLLSMAIKFLLIIGTITEKLDAPFAGLRPFRWLATPLQWPLLRFMVPQGHWLQADKRAADIIGSDDEVAKVLIKLDSFFSTHRRKFGLEQFPMLLVCPLTKKAKKSYLAVHPATETRVRNLVGKFPI